MAAPFLAGCLQDQVVEVKTLERDILLTWIALEREDTPRIAAYGAAVQQDWILLQYHHGLVPVKPAFLPSVVRLNLWMTNLSNAVNYGDRERALTAIHLLQNEIRVLRPQLGMRQSTDQLYDFYYQWQAVVDASNDPAQCQLDDCEYSDLYERAASSWRKHAANPQLSSGILFPGYTQNTTTAEAAALAVTNRLDDFAPLLESTDSALIAKLSLVINKLFFDYLAVVTAYISSESTATAVSR